MKKFLILIIITLFSQNIFADEKLEKQEKLTKKFDVLFAKVKVLTIQIHF